MSFPLLIKSGAEIYYANEGHTSEDKETLVTKLYYILVTVGVRGPAKAAFISI